MDRDLLEVTIPQLEQLYRSHKYTVTEGVRWYLARIEKYNRVYRAVQNLELPGAHATAAREDAEAKVHGNSFVRGPMWGVPIPAGLLLGVGNIYSVTNRDPSQTNDRGPNHIGVVQVGARLGL
jgi:hypothetical protein